MEESQIRLFKPLEIVQGTNYLLILPSYAVLEMPAMASGKGFLPLGIDYFPDSLAAIINQRLACVELTVDAALEGDRRLMVEAMLADGAVRDKETAQKLTNELLKAHKGLLPQFS